MSKPLHIAINPNIYTDPAKTYFIRVEGDKDQVFNLLDHAEKCGCDYYEIVQSPAGVDISTHKFKEIRKPPIKGFYAYIKYYDSPNEDPRRVFIAQTINLDEDHPDDLNVFFYAGDYPEKEIREEFAYRNNPLEDWYIDEGCGCENNPPCIGCVPKTYLPDEPNLSEVPVDPDANRLNLYAVWTINSDTSETEKTYIMALHEEGAACLYHKSRARDHGNILCEVVVSKVADAEVCDG